MVVGLLFSRAWFVFGCSGGLVSVTWAGYHGSGVMSQSLVTPPENVEGKGDTEPICA